MIIVRSVFCIVAVFLSIASFAQRKPILIRAVLYLHTNENKGKSIDTVTIEVNTKNRLLAHTKISLNKEKINNKFDYQEELIIDAKGVEKTDCLGYIVSMLKKTTSKQGLWKFNARVEFYFSDNYVIAADEVNIKLDKDNTSIQFLSF